MLEIYCAHEHHSKEELCLECQSLLEYAAQRLSKCPYQAVKPACVRCPIHCYQPDKRRHIRRVMSYAGPRMLFRHPILAVLHLWDDVWHRNPQKIGRKK